MKASRLLLAGLVFCAAAALVRAEEKVDGAKLVGKWEATKADPGTIPVGSTVEFTAKNTMKVVHKADGKEIIGEGTYKVDGDKFAFELKIGDNTTKKTITIKKLTDTELMTADEQGKSITFKKVK
jgi:uncharacterized protein (TIGR03066 family)